MADLLPAAGQNTVQVTVDDFDPLVSYANYDDWTTPDPSLNPTWYNETEAVTGSPWHQGEQVKVWSTPGMYCHGSRS